MKDFDFDELDRAVNSVLAPKDTNADGITDTDTSSQDANGNDDSTQTVDTHAQSDDAAQPVAVNNNDDAHDDASDAGDVMAVDTPQADSTESTEAPVSEDTVPVTSPETDHHDESSTEEQASSEEDQPYEDAPQEPSVGETDVDDESSEDSTENVDTAPEATPSTPSTSLAAIPVKRGRFMDMIAPASGTDLGKRPALARGGITLTPSVDFSANETSSDQVPTEAEKPVVDVATPIVESDVEPEVSATTSDVAEDSRAEEHNDETYPADSQETTDEDNLTAPATDTTPFIADVPVDKRPLNDLSGETQGDAVVESASSDVDISADPTLTATLPKEYDKDIMAVEANETVGEHDETHSQDTSGTNSTSPLTLSSDTGPAAAMAATTAEPHPMFDTSTLGHEDAHGHHNSKMTWVVVGLSLFIVGAALGVLYFLYGQG